MDRPARQPLTEWFRVAAIVGALQACSAVAPQRAGQRAPAPSSERPGTQPEGSIGRQGISPLARAHAHNDYEHERPLLDAIDRGFTSVEADVWLVEGALLVAHERRDVDPHRTLESLYLQPLLALVQRRHGVVQPGFAHSLQLVIDVKSEAEPTYLAIDALLRRYSSMFTRFTPSGVHEGAVTAVISGNSAGARIAAQSERFAGRDGRIGDVQRGARAELTPLISDRWSHVFDWQGDGPMPQVERQKLVQLVETVHANGQRIRFWSTPDETPRREAVWAALIAAGVDYINTDQLAALRAFLLEADPHPATPELDWFHANGSEPRPVPHSPPEDG